MYSIFHNSNLFRKIKIIARGNYFVTNDKSYVDDGLAANHIFDFLHDEKLFGFSFFLCPDMYF